MILSLGLLALSLATASPLDGAKLGSQASFQISQDGSLQQELGHTTIPPLQGMVHRSLALSGPIANRVNLVFFGDGYTHDQQEQFFEDAQKLTADIIRPNASYGPVAALLNMHAVFVPSNETGIGTHGQAKNTVFGLYRPGSELRGVFYKHKRRVMQACEYWRNQGKGCDEPILLGNDPLYGGLGGTPTVITASKVNGPLVLRHELGHTLIPAGEEYDGGYAYFGANSAPLSALQDGLSWEHWLSEPDHGPRMEDSKVPLQAYPWRDLVSQPYETRFSASNGSYPTALLRLSIAGIPYESHLDITLNGILVNYSIPLQSRGENDRAWIQVPLESGLGTYGDRSRELELLVRLTEAGRSTPVPQGGKMLSSVELIEYGPAERFNKTRGYIGAFATYDEHGNVTLRPTDETCLMRDVTYSSFCPVCLESLYLALLGRVDLIDDLKVSCDKIGHGAVLETTLVDLEAAEIDFTWKFEGQPIRSERPTVEVTETGWYSINVSVKVPEIRKEDLRLQSARRIWFGGCNNGEFA